MSDFDDILNDTEAEETAQPEQPEMQDAHEQATEAPEAEQQPQEEAAPPEPVAEKQPEHMVPVSVVKELRDELRSLKEQRQQAPQQPAEVPDVFEDQAGFAKHFDSRLRDATMATKVEMSRFMAERELGKEAVEEAIEYFNQPQNMAQSWQFMDKPSPIHAAVEYVQAQKVAQEIGSDPAAYKAKLAAEIREQIKAEMAAEQAKQMAAKAPPSMANVNGSGGGKVDPGWQGPVDLESLIG